jgi:hypothetical protein
VPGLAQARKQIVAQPGGEGWRQREDSVAAIDQRHAAVASDLKKLEHRNRIGDEQVGDGLDVKHVAGDRAGAQDPQHVVGEIGQLRGGRLLDSRPFDHAVGAEQLGQRIGDRSRLDGEHQRQPQPAGLAERPGYQIAARRIEAVEGVNPHRDGSFDRCCEAVEGADQPARVHPAGGPRLAEATRRRRLHQRLAEQRLDVLAELEQRRQRRSRQVAVDGDVQHLGGRLDRADGDRVVAVLDSRKQRVLTHRPFLLHGAGRAPLEIAQTLRGVPSRHALARPRRTRRPRRSRL